MTSQPSVGLQGRARHRGLLSDPLVRAWYDERALRSQLSADIYLRQLGGISSRLDLTLPEVEVAAKKTPDALSRRLVKYAANLKSQGRLDSYIAKTFDGLRSWFKFRHVTFDGFPKLDAARGVTLERERVPTPEELRRVLDRLSTRGKVIALLMAHSGVRPGVLGTYGAVDGLRLKNLPELSIEKRPSFEESPFTIRVPARLSKTRKMYTTFGSQELASSLLAYLDERIATGEKVSTDSPVVTVDHFAATHTFHGRTGVGRFLTTKAIVLELREALTSGVPEGVTWRPYVLRSYCSTRLLMAEGHGKISRDLREAILGHDGGVAARYNVGKLWGKEMLEEARASYKECEPFLSTMPVKAPQDTQANIAKVMLLGLGYSDEELTDKDLLDPQVFQQLVKDKMMNAASRQKQKLVEAEALPQYLEEGWTVVTAVNGHQVVLNPPGR